MLLAPLTLCPVHSGLPEGPKLRDCERRRADDAAANSLPKQGDLEDEKKRQQPTAYERSLHSQGRIEGLAHVWRSRGAWSKRDNLQRWPTLPSRLLLQSAFSNLSILAPCWPMPQSGDLSSSLVAGQRTWESGFCHPPPGTWCDPTGIGSHPIHYRDISRSKQI
ncbi:hypothetical protein ACJZ2D_001456 [Fusarium nematophilum]